MNQQTTFGARAEELERVFASRPLIRAVNFHSTPRIKTDHYERQPAHYSGAFSSVNEDELDLYLTTGIWHKKKPGLIVSVFEGYRDSYEVLTPLIEKYAFIGWYWIITGFINSAISDQRHYAEQHDIYMLTHEYSDGRYALTWDELRQLDKRHIIACHTRSHTLLSALAPAIRREEIVGSQHQFRKHLGHPVRGFVSLTGPAYGEDAITGALVDEAGFEYVFSNFRIQLIRARDKSPKS